MIKSEKRLFIPLNRLYFRILSYFLSLLLPILIIGTVFYFYSTAHLMEADTQKIVMNLQSSAATIEAYLRTTEETSASFFYDTRALLRPYDEYSLEERVRMPRIPESIASKSSMLGSLVDKMFVFVDTKKVYTGEGLNDFDFFFRNYSFQNYDQRYWEQKLLNAKSLEILDATEVKLNNWQKKNVIPFVFTNTINGHRAVVVITVATNTILKTLSDHSVVDSTTFIITDGRNHMILNSAADSLKPEALSQLTEYFRDNNKTHGEINIAHANSVVTHVKSETYGWNYYSVTPVSVFQKQTSYFIASIAATCLALVVVGVIFSFIFAFNIYSPIKRIRDILDQPSDRSDDVTVTGKFNAFDDIGIRINRLIERNHKFKHELATMSTEYMEKSLMNLFHGNISRKAEEQLGKMLRNDVSFQKPSFVCCSVWFEFKELFYNDIQDVDRMRILSKMKKIIWGLLRQYVDVYLLEVTDSLYISVINVIDEDDMHQVKKALQNMIDTFRYDSQFCVICIGVGKRYEGVAGIAKSYLSAMNALDFADQTADFQIIDAAQLPPAVTHHSYSFIDENAIINCLKAGDAQNLRLKLEEIVDKNKRKGISRHHISALLSEMYNTGYRFLDERGIDPQTVTQLFGGLDPSAGYEKQKLQLYQFFDDIMAHTALPAHESSSQIASVIIKYIEENYHQDLGLERIADNMGVSAKYVSRVFKEKTGTNLVGYISSYRMAKAKQLLAETELNIKEISERVGIYSRTTFIRLFKKHEGTTPHLYRNAARAAATMAKNNGETKLTAGKTP
ncbi:hypothetical protein SD70_07450 [Gordoniibacillus kamchatkensis]|uniref:HTH araC/xylS-type domain-containing protein n=1 Tax=Gordoniibacillus kamchatkensis TaxID=1590651 RepID=A0ABR5AK92_9BACL|nr:helix-turn-helix domain-containing protein [Paenibacillus sp. VKM B-2647]KIL41459.1 hypothetical protein SD70_07450 [Paenibacillus sp. VKM B-2647]